MPPDQPGTGPALPSSDERWLQEWLGRTWRHWQGWIVLHGFVVGASVAVAAHAASRSAGAPQPLAIAATLGVLVASLAIFASGGLRTMRPVIDAAEAAAPMLRNALVAWHETHATVARPIAQRLATHARQALEKSTRPRPYSGASWLAVLALRAAGVAANVFLAVPSVTRRVDVARPEAPRNQGVPTAALRWVTTVTPPSYTGRPTTRSVQPAQIDVLAGSRIDIAFAGWPDGATLRLGTTPIAVERPARTPAVHLVATSSDVLLVRNAQDVVVATMAIVVHPDGAPAVRILAPAADLRRDVATGQVAIRIAARDDIGLRDLRLRFTKVSGSGESFTFEDGEWPVSRIRTSATEWTGTHELDLAGLGLGPGDSVVYYALAHDARIGAEGAAESERFLIEITRPGALSAGDFSLPEPEEKFALSQRMVIQLTERLLEKRPRLSAEMYRQEAQALAIAQRRVRAEFVFMLGGEVEDEFEEAAHAHEIEAGRLDNRGQNDLTVAVRQMSQAETRLTAADLREALPYEYRALAALQAAFGKARYFMRTLPAHVQIDVARRLQGDRARASSASWQQRPLSEEGRAAALALLQRLEDARGPAAPWLPELVALDRSDAAWVALVQRAAAEDGVPGVVAALRARLLPGSTHWMSLPLARGRGEAVAAATGGARP
jgi:hypothetical protein